MLVLVSVLGLLAPVAAPPSREITREMRAPSAEICSENDGRPPPVLPVPLAFVFVVFVVFVLVTVSGLREGGATDVMLILTLTLSFWFVGFVWCSATSVLVLLVLEVLELVKLLVRRTSIGSAAARSSTRRSCCCCCSSVGLWMRSRVVMAFLSFILICSSGFQ